MEVDRVDPACVALKLLHELARYLRMRLVSFEKKTAHRRSISGANLAMKAQVEEVGKVIRAPGRQHQAVNHALFSVRMPEDT